MNPLTILTGDCRELLKTLPEKSVHSIVTSPPYWGLRNYGHPDQIGQEETPQVYVEAMRLVFSELHRVLRDDGTVWLNLGDSYGGGGGSGGAGKTAVVWNTRSNKQHRAVGGKSKNLVGIPWRVAFALQEDGWYLRSEIIWHKPSAMPESVTDRPTKSHEQIFLLTKSSRYFYDAEAIKEPVENSGPKGDWRLRPHNGSEHGTAESLGTVNRFGTGEGGRRNKRTVWSVNSKPYNEAHFACYPPDLIKPCILAGTSARGCCAKCGAPYKRQTETTGKDWNAASRRDGVVDVVGNSGAAQMPKDRIVKTVGWQPGCKCDAGIVPCAVLDPFGGSGTTGEVALELGRNAILIELNLEYIQLMKWRTNVTQGLPM